MKASTDELKIFVTVVESGSFSRAARQLELATSAVSRAVKKLEAKLGVELLTRTTRQISLTQEGEGYFRKVQKLLQEMAAAENELMESRQVPRGLLRVDAATPVVLHLLTPMMAPFRQRYPEMTLSLISSETFINLIERKVDVAIRAGNLTDSSLRARPLFTSYRKMIAAPAYLARCGVPVSVDELAQHSCLGFVETPALNRWPVAQPDGELYTIQPTITANSGETLKQLCLAGNGIACLSDYMIDKELSDGSLVEVLADKRLPVAMPFNAVYYSDRAVSTRVRAFIDFLGEWINEHHLL
ncbi:DNA-binding transcriptional regulator YafC [Mixta calida]|uniref:LysR family transcriptional regulator n=1 Tax=Mixta calida TaxID=665913 RepID=A0ABM6RXU4_9GAMM|nr:DNA-binding transcriptional regulator YafC [Mixta calida]AUY24305.1 LysR family transcriptional regulator [Mixta calida]KAF0859496.1 LysR family transcriptional regulator [Mixta calida B021323]MDU5770222.1 DNA-binding transcriptional regulator YafC [Mixta calida]MDU5827243.1 DNA-binding transcriptional regulator YafC [Mixta calida]ORM54220.1 LysR family transcriptional regulator [Mixta calida]